MFIAIDSVKRAVCTICHRPQSACICQWITPVEAEVEVLILQHPLEVNNAKNSARLLHLCLPGSRLVVGEVFDEADLADPARQDVLLYPDEPLSSTMPAMMPAQIRLIVLDATWRKSRKMLHLNPWLRELPRMALNDALPSRYLIRKAHKPGQLSTLEATCAALAQLELDAQKYLPLLQSFDGFVAQQAAWMAGGGQYAER